MLEKCNSDFRPYVLTVVLYVIVVVLPATKFYFLKVYNMIYIYLVFSSPIPSRKHRLHIVHINCIYFLFCVNICLLVTFPQDLNEKILNQLKLSCNSSPNLVWTFLYNVIKTDSLLTDSIAVGNDTVLNLFFLVLFYLYLALNCITLDHFLLWMHWLEYCSIL